MQHSTTLSSRLMYECSLFSAANNVLSIFLNSDNWASLWENRSSGFPTRSDTNQAVQPQKMATGLKFRIKGEAGLYYPCSENEGADQLCSYHKADLRLCFRICKKPVFSFITRLNLDQVFSAYWHSAKCKDGLNGLINYTCAYILY